MLSAPIDIAANLARVREGIDTAAVRAGRQPDEVTLIGISKTQPVEAIVQAITAGVAHIGENRVQEAAQKLPRARQLLADVPMTCHLVGHLQTNKAAAALELFDCLDSVDSLHLAEALSRRIGGTTTMPILLEVYVGSDSARPGFRPAELVEATGRILELPGLRVDGLMTVAPLDGEARVAFRQVREIRDTLAEAYPRVHFGVLSMGMSGDFEAAIEEGSTQVRIGTALFGARSTH